MNFEHFKNIFWFVNMPISSIYHTQKKEKLFPELPLEFSVPTTEWFQNLITTEEIDITYNEKSVKISANKNAEDVLKIIHENFGNISQSFGGIKQVSEKIYELEFY